MIDSQSFPQEEKSHRKKLSDLQNQFPQKPLWVLLNKTDKNKAKLPSTLEAYPCLQISAKSKTGIEALKQVLVRYMEENNYQDESIITNSRHYAALSSALTEISKVQKGLHEGLSGDLLAIDLRQALFHLGRLLAKLPTMNCWGIFLPTSVSENKLETS